MSQKTAFPSLQGKQYMNLITFRKSGEQVSTPVWFALVGDRCYIVSDGSSGKVKRIRNNPQVEFEPSDGRGNSQGPRSSGRAAILDQAAGISAHEALKAKYGWMYQAFAFFWRIRKVHVTYLEVQEEKVKGKG